MKIENTPYPLNGPGQNELQYGFIASFRLYDGQANNNAFLLKKGKQRYLIEISIFAISFLLFSIC